MGFPQPTVDVVRNVIQTQWHKGLQTESPYHGSHEFKLKGFPWNCSWADSVHARRLVSHLLRVLFDAGWLLYTSTGVSNMVSDLDTLIFRFQ